MLNQKDVELHNILQSSVQGLGFELWGCEYIAQGKHSVLRIYIDSDNGITIDDCAEVAQQLNGVLDVEDPIRGEYRLEVSSPGIDRQLFFPAQFSRYIGHEVKFRLNHAIDNRRKFAGVIKAVNDETLTLAYEDRVAEFQLADIDKANLVE